MLFYIDDLTIGEACALWALLMIGIIAFCWWDEYKRTKDDFKPWH